MEYVYGIGASWISETKNIYTKRGDNLDYQGMMNYWTQSYSKKDVKLFRMIQTILNIRYKTQGIYDPEHIMEIIFETLLEGFQLKSNYEKAVRDGGRLSVSTEDFEQVKRTFSMVAKKLQSTLDYKQLSEKERFERFLEVLSVTQSGTDEEDDKKILISSIHGYKGREADYVFHYHTNPIGTFKADFSEMCAFYVGCTRAKKKMFLTGNRKSYTQKFQMKDTSKNKFLDSFYRSVGLELDKQKIS
jgi:superfamily I DNA/RNA helicase